MAPAPLSSARSPRATVIRPLVATGIHRAYDREPVLDGVDLVVSPGDRLGLIGENGAGKSTLLRILAGVEPPDAGQIERPARVGYLPQEVEHDPVAPLSSVIEDAVAPLRALERRLETAASDLAVDPHADAAYAAALDEAEALDLWSWESRRDALLDGFGVAGIPLETPLGSISGGQRSRLALAALLLARPDALLLDEPTNHLDDAAVALLQRELRAWSGPVLLASHDRALLDDVATGLVDLDPSRRSASGENGGGMLTRFGGGFSAYLVERALERERWEERVAAEERELRRARGALTGSARALDGPDRPPRDNDKFVRNFKRARQQSATSRRVRAAEQLVADLEASRLSSPPAVLTFAGIPTGSTALADATLVQLTDARIDGRLAPVSLRIGGTDRVLVTGANGAGKSTLLAAIAGALALDGGRRTSRRGLRVGLLAQDVRFADPSATPRALYARAAGERRAETQPLAGLGLIAPRDLDRAVGSLSTGQQRRLALALVIARPPHLFLLDEPTNHLSLQLAGELEEALGEYPGAVVVASHDRWLRARWEERVVRL